jgi:hypothetical protein
MTDSEYEKLAAVAEGDGMTLGEWVREMLLERMEGRKPSAIEEAVLAETRKGTELALDEEVTPVTTASARSRGPMLAAW